MPGKAGTRRTLYLWVVLGLAELCACGLDAGLHPDPGGANGGDGSDFDGSAVLSAGGVGAWDASNTLFGSGNDAGSAGFSSSGGIGSGGAGSASGGFGGAISGGGSGAAGAGGFGSGGVDQAGAADDDAGGAPPLPHALLFSEYVEGSGTNKALEIVALTRSSLNGCAIQTYFNGRSDAGASVPLAGELADGEVWTVCTSSLTSALGAICRQSANLTFNGNDAVLLACDGVTLDAIGQLGVDPGTCWGEGEIRTADHTLRRSCDVTRGDTVVSDAFEPALEWLGYPSDSFDGLGSRDCAAPRDAGSSDAAVSNDAAAQP